jgi:ribosomal protein S8
MKYEKGIAGLFAAINLIKDNRAVLPGKEVKKALDKYNPSFKTSSPKIYEALGNITFIANNNGIIIVQTVDGDDILIDKIKMESDAKIKINILANGDAVIDVLSGVKVGKVVVWYKMNFIKLFKTSGDLLFDYDSDHTQKRVNLKKDILY